jgi:hypothetical protein
MMPDADDDDVQCLGTFPVQQAGKIVVSTGSDQDNPIRVLCDKELNMKEKCDSLCQEITQAATVLRRGTKEHKRLTMQRDKTTTDVLKLCTQLQIFKERLYDGKNVQGMTFFTECIQDNDHFIRVANVYMQKGKANMADVMTKRSRCIQIEQEQKEVHAKVCSLETLLRETKEALKNMASDIQAEKQVTACAEKPASENEAEKQIANLAEKPVSDIAAGGLDTTLDTESDSD